MKFGRHLITFFFALSFCLSQGFTQEHSEAKEVFHPHHVLGITLSHAHVFQGRDVDGNKKVLALPSWGLNYTYFFKPNWGIGLHTDLIIETFEVEKHLEGGGNAEVIERETPISPALAGIYKPNDHWIFSFGAGVEFEKEESFFLNRAGV